MAPSPNSVDNNLTGTLPPELGLLTRLRRLSLHNNLGIRGSIPDSFQNLRNLEIVTLQINKLTGSIPDWLGRWTGLQVLGLNTNRLTGLLPASLNQLTQLTNLALDNNRLSGEIGVLQTLTNLKMLFLDNNQFRGQLGYDAFQNHRALVHLGLSDNDFVGTLPLYLFQVENLAVLDLHGNFFTGVLPEFATNDALQFLALHDNGISESVPSSITNLHALTHLDLARNNLTQAMPEIFDSMTNLDSLFLSDNPFTAGPIPDLANLKYLSIKATHRTGVIPTWIGKLDNLLSVDLGSNGLRARLPSEMGSLENLAYLLLNENFLTGSIPDTFTQLTKLKLILIENNTITGSTTSVCALPAISTFVSDCMGPVAELECTCCKPCCHDASPSCGDTDAVNQVNSIWEVGYGRNDKDFNGEIYDS
jgi:Leucine-rich repeat (LRR) protein